jgi:hypothetical protein
MKAIHISNTSTSGPRMVGLLLPLSNSHSTHTNLSQLLLWVSALYRYTWRCPSHFLIFKMVILGKQSAPGNRFVWSFFFVSVHKTRIQNMSSYFRSTLYKDYCVLHLSVSLFTSRKSRDPSLLYAVFLQHTKYQCRISVPENRLFTCYTGNNLWK